MERSCGGPAEPPSNGATVNTTLCVQLISGQTGGERNGRGAVTIVELIVTGDKKGETTVTALDGEAHRISRRKQGERERGIEKGREREGLRERDRGIERGEGVREREGFRKREMERGGGRERRERDLRERGG